MRTLCFSMPWPPSLNKLWRAVGGKMLLSAVARKYKRDAANVFAGTVADPLKLPVAVTLVFNPPEALVATGQRWDIANREKLLCDALTAQRVWLDDSQVDVMLLVRGTVNREGSVDVLIKEV